MLKPSWLITLNLLGLYFIPTVNNMGDQPYNLDPRS